MKTMSLLVILSSLSAASLTAHAGGDPVAGKTIAAEKCQACHGVDGNGDNPQYPRLAGQHANYLVQALADYKSGVRNNPIMAGFAAGLSEQDQKNVAAWFASQKGSLYTPVEGRSVSR